MKKIFFLLSFIVLVLGIESNAQNSLYFDKQLKEDESFLPFIGGASDVIGVAGDSTWQYTVKKVTPEKQLPYVYLKLNRVNTTGTVSVYLYSKHTLNTPDTLISTAIVWKKTTADTLIMISPSTYRISDYTKILIKGSTSATGGKVTYLDFKIVEY